jgi:predicted methyltransferase MtxX (methanogen marker protein 4)
LKGGGIKEVGRNLEENETLKMGENLVNHAQQNYYKSIREIL